MSANHAPQLSQLICMSTPDPVEAEKASLREQLTAVSAGLVAKAKCMPDDQEDMQEEKMMWLRHWEEKMQWTVEEVEACAKAEQDVQMGEETMVELGNDGAVKMSHVEVLQPACKASQHGHCPWQTVAESDKEPAWLKIHIPAMGTVTHKEPCMWCTLKGVSCTGTLGKTCNACARIKQGCEKSSKVAGKKVQVVESRAHGKGKAPVYGGLDDKTAMALSRALTIVRAKAMASHAATMHLRSVLTSSQRPLNTLA
ncbi:hypothetical protein F5J12DRAFT_786992 [Pisolithus orientalis]|uniref:uncharacterized protein n=1 Tax=Pisolithus orientalis TaxID=936130 RepID=UPI00222545D3|nr:uncharacterized protein F5J12DRAFT_786992 [Pisolithus orientalis]KAI5987922.1 hypothetical protein F5J12DRAFT_786992 [Pisolithus orientalis]